MKRLLPLLLAVACAKRLAPESDYAPAPAAAAGRAMAKDDWAPPPPPAPPASADASAAAEPAPAPAAARMVHYQGFAALRVGKTEEAVETVIALAADAGGGLEQQYGNTVVLRVPVARFQEVFDAVLKVGDVTKKSIQAEDVTDAFTAVELRLKTAQARRDRLVQLLAQSKDENEKLALVREIQEVTEEIDRLEQQVRTLQRLADFSRITVQIEQRPALTWKGGEPESAAFGWIRALSPFEQNLDGKKLALDTPEGFVALDVKRRFVAESAEGARVWSARLGNDPVGDTTFWTEALKRRIGPEFAAADGVTVGDWQGLRLLDRGDTPYVWVVLVRASGKDLDVFQAFYPSVDAEKRHAPAVRAILAGGAA